MSGSNIYQSIKKSTELKLVHKGKFNFSKDILLFCTLRNEAIRMPFFIDFYRALGVQHFFFVDNESDDGFLDLVQNEDDITVYLATGSYKDSNFGMDWLNYLLRKYGQDKWCITCDPDEFLVYPHIETLSIDSLIEELESEGSRSFYTPLIDMYGKEAGVEYEAGHNPLTFTPYFDKLHTFTIGPRGRVFCENDAENIPNLNKYCLIKWDKSFNYIHSMHWASPTYLNWTSVFRITGAMFHFKFLSTFKTKVQEELQRKEHFNDSSEYKKYASQLDSMNFYDPLISEKYQNSLQLLTLGLIKSEDF